VFWIINLMSFSRLSFFFSTQKFFNTKTNMGTHPLWYVTPSNGCCCSNSWQREKRSACTMNFRVHSVHSGSRTAPPCGLAERFFFLRAMRKIPGRFWQRGIKGWPFLVNIVKYCLRLFTKRCTLDRTDLKMNGLNISFHSYESVSVFAIQWKSTEFQQYITNEKIQWRYIDWNSVNFHWISDSHWFNFRVWTICVIYFAGLGVVSR